MQDISFVLLGFFTGISLILAIGAQNIFVIEQGLKKQYIENKFYSIVKKISKIFK